MALTILADDLTGACDSGALLAGRAAVPVTVWPAGRAAGAVSVVDTESRGLGAAEAAARGAGAVPAAARVGEALEPALDRPVAWLPLAEVRGGPAALAARLGRLTGAVAVADAETEQDLAALVDAALEARPA